MKKNKLVPFLITIFINLIFIFWMIFSDQGGPCAPGAGTMIGLFVFIPMTVIALIISGIFVIVTKHNIAKGIALAELITIIVLAILFMIISF